MSAKRKGGVVVEIANLERIVSSLAIHGESPRRIARRLGLSVRSIQKLLENVGRKISKTQNNRKERGQS